MSQRETRTVSFGITGEFLTNIAREWFYLEGKDYEKVIELLMSGMSGTDTPEPTIRRYAEDILIGRAALKGSTTDGTYHLETHEPDEQEEMHGTMNIWKRFSRNVQENKKLRKELERMTERYTVAMEYVPVYLQKEVRKELGEETAEDRQQTALDSFIKRMTDEEEHETEDYGWLEPDGTFHAVDWGEHQDWAQEYIEKHYPEVEDDDKVDMQIVCNAGLIGAGDWLVGRGWVLMHNPSQGIAFPTKNPVKEYTKAQKEFLYDYYMDRNCEREANAIWKGEEGGAE